MFVSFDDQSLSQKVVQHVNHKQRISFRSFVDQRCQRCWKSIVWKSNKQILDNLTFAKVFETQLLALLLGPQLPLDCLEGMPTQYQLDRTISPNQHKLRRVTLTCQVCDQIKS